MSESARQGGNGSGKTHPAFVTRLRERISQSVLSVTSGSGPTLDYSRPPGDPGLFGPDAICWQVHADFTSMLIGGMSGEDSGAGNSEKRDLEGNPQPPEGGLGLMFLAAAAALGLILTAVAVVAYLAMR